MDTKQEETRGLRWLPPRGQRRRMLIRIPLALAVSLLLLAGLAAAALWYCCDMPGTSWVGPSPALTPLQVASSQRLQRDVRVLSEEIGERHMARYEDLRRSAAWLRGQLEAAGYQVTSDAYTIHGRTVENLVVELPGDKMPEEVVLVGAHYDSVVDCPGADDNASGTAATLELARLMAGQPSARTLRFVFFVNEEPPWFKEEEMGSLVYARRARERGDQITAMYSLETLGMYRDQPNTQLYPHPVLRWIYPDQGNFVAFVGMTDARALVRRSVASFREEAKLPSEGMAAPAAVPGVDYSDHWSFQQEGYPAVMVTDTAFLRNEHYHEPTDTAAHLDFDRLALAVDALRSMLRQEAAR